ncbi:DMT family transporter [Ancylomarina sp. DW003]|nr:DMT family transporter [Ancylomarina sp. DW003]MDE5420956.1 DMT family transporter [Ancylomarina sp. DW003]
MKKQTKAYIFALTAILSWSTVATAFKIALEGMDYIHLLAISSTVAMFFFSLFLFFKGDLISAIKRPKPELIHSAFLGFLNPFLYYFILLKAYSLLSAQLALSLNYIWPITLVLLSIPLLKQKIGLKSIACILLSFVGVIVIANKGSITSIETSNSWGIILALGSSIIWALFWIYNTKDSREDLNKLFLNFLFGAIYSIIALVILGQFSFPDLKSLSAAVYIGLVECGIAYIFWLKAMKLSESTDKIGNLVFLSPFISLFLIHLFIGETIYLSTWIGLSIIVIGIILQKISIKN